MLIQNMFVFAFHMAYTDQIEKQLINSVADLPQFFVYNLNEQITM